MTFGQLSCRPFLKYRKEDQLLDQALAEQEEEVGGGKAVRKGSSATGQTESGTVCTYEACTVVQRTTACSVCVCVCVCVYIHPSFG